MKLKYVSKDKCVGLIKPPEEERRGSYICVQKKYLQEAIDCLPDNQVVLEIDDLKSPQNKDKHLLLIRTRGDIEQSHVLAIAECSEPSPETTKSKKKTEFVKNLLRSEKFGFTKFEKV